MVFANHGNFKNRGKARTRYMPAEMGGAEAFIKTYEETIVDSHFKFTGKLDIKTFAP